MEDRISNTESKIKEIVTSVNENVKIKTLLPPHPTPPPAKKSRKSGTLGKDQIYKGRRNPGQKHRRYFQQNYRKKNP